MKNMGKGGVGMFREALKVKSNLVMESVMGGVLLVRAVLFT